MTLDDASLYEDNGIEGDHVTNEAALTDEARHNSNPTIRVQDSNNDSKDGAPRGRPSRPATPSSRASTHSRRSLSITPEPSPARRPTNPTFAAALETDTAPILSPEAISSAPPDYWDVTRGQRAGGTTAHPTVDNDPSGAGYGTMSDPALFRSRGNPQAMADMDAHEPLLGQEGGHSRKRRWRQRRCCGMLTPERLLVIACSLLIVVIFVVELVLRVRPKKDTSPGSGNGVWKGPSVCPEATYNGSAEYTFGDVNQFKFIEIVRDTYQAELDGQAEIHTSGTVRVRRASTHLQNVVRVEATLHYTSPKLLSKLGVNKQADILELLPPSHIPHEDDVSAKPCAVIDAVIWVNPGAKFELFNVATTNLAIVFDDDLSLTSNTIDIQTKEAPIHFPNTNTTKDVVARDIVIETLAGRISGTYPLYDSLRISSSAGSVRVKVDPKEVDKSAPKPAQFQVQSVAGSIDVEYPTVGLALDGSSQAQKVPKRDYVSSLSTAAGNMNIRNLLHGSYTGLKTNAGRIRATLVPAGPPGDKSRISVSANAGSTEVLLTPHVFEPKAALKHLSADYVHHFGRLQLQYPLTWEGKVEGYTLSGRIDVDWEGLSWHEKGKGERIKLSRHFVGSVGNGTGQLYFQGSSGSAKLIGKSTGPDGLFM